MAGPELDIKMTIVTKYLIFWLKILIFSGPKIWEINHILNFNAENHEEIDHFN